MDDIRPPRRPAAPGADIAGVAPRRPMPSMPPTPPHTPVVQPPKVEAPETPEVPASEPKKVPIMDHDKPSAFEAPTLDDLKLETPSDIDAAVEGRPAQPEDPTPPPAAAPIDTEVIADAVEEEAETPEPDTVSEEKGEEPAEEPKDKPLDLPATNESAPEPSSSLLAEIEAQEKADAEGLVKAAPITQPPRKSRGPAIFIAIIFALALIGGAGYAYWANNKQAAKTPTPTKTTTTKTETKKPATVDDIDTTAKDIQASIDKIDETKQLQESDLTDTTLGIQ